MKTRICSHLQCGDRRVHWANQDTPRGPQKVDVKDDYPDTAPIYCSFSCAMSDGAFDVKKGPLRGVTTKSGYELPPEPVR